MGVQESYWKAVEPYWDRISIYDGAAVFLAAFERTPEVSRNLFAGHWCQSEVCNGGFDQFFGNSTGILAPEAVTAFHAIGVHGLASLVERAMARLGPNYSRDRERRNAIIETLGPNAFELLDEEFFALVGTENGGWRSAADAYAAANGG